MKRIYWTGLVALVVLLGQRSARADDFGDAGFDDDVQHNVSLTISPIHLAFPIVEVTGEFRVDDTLGVAALVGVGQVDGFNTYELGGQVRYYAFGSFIHGMQLGGEVLYLNIDADAFGSSISATGLSAGPFIGYKIATNVGFTFEIQAGVAYASAKAESSTSSASQSGVIPLANINLGWSF